MDWKSLLEQFPAREVSVAGRRFSYRSAGSGPDLVLLHGIGSGSGSWVHQLAHFQASHRVTAWDAPGYGGSDALKPTEPAAADYAGALGLFLEALDIERPVLVGHSLGALMAGAFAAGHANKLAGLVFAAPGLGYARAPAEVRQAMLDERLSSMAELGPEGLARVRAPKLVAEGASDETFALVRFSLARLVPAGYAAAAHMLANGDLAGDAAGIEMQVLVLCGDADIVTPPDATRDFAAGLPRAEYKEIPGAGHICYVEQPEIFNTLLGDYAAARP